jgi:ATP-dependent Clp endopeptidase proteolytic subunit ClpP
MRNWYSMKAEGGVGEIIIYDVIGKSYWDDDAVSAEKFNADLKALGDVSKIKLRVNSPGGDVMDGVAIHNMLKNHKADVEAHIDGIAASAASYVVMAADKIIAPANTFMLIHEPHGIAFGTKADMERVAADLGRMTDSFTATYSSRSGQSAEAVGKLMAEDRLMTATEAKELGYVDEVTADVKMAAKFAAPALACLPEKARATFKAALDKDAPPPVTPPAPPAAAAAAASPPAETGGNVVSLDAARPKLQAEFTAYAAEVRDLCALAGYPGKAADFIAAYKPVAEVRTALAKAKADREPETVVGQHADTGTSGSTVTTAQAKAGWGKAVKAVNARAGLEKAEK